MKRLDVKYLYEDAFLGLVSYAYALEWGNESQQLADLQRAIGHERAASYLRKEAFQAVRAQALILNFKLRRYAEAMDLWRMMLKSLDPGDHRENQTDSERDRARATFRRAIRHFRCDA
jgi:tetratricopeptide (TPR) repeat protein